MAEFDFADLDKRMNGALENLKRELAGLRTGRASASLLDPITVEAYGAQMPLNQVATVSVPEPRMLSVQVWDKTMVSPVEKAILQGGLGLNPVVDGQLVRIPLPDLSEDRRKELVKIAGQYCEKSKIAVRNVRRDGMETLKTLEKDGEMSKDEQHAEGENVQELTDDYIKKLEELLTTKEAEIMQV